MLYLSEKYFSENLSRDMNYQKVRDHCHYAGKFRGPSPSICNLKFNVSNKIPIVFHNRLKYDYHFIIKELAKEFESSFECNGENN